MQTTAFNDIRSLDLVCVKEDASHNSRMSPTVIRSLEVMPSLVQVAAGTQEATDYGGNNGHKEHHS